jgi:hypothetical protein
MKIFVCGVLSFLAAVAPARAQSARPPKLSIGFDVGQTSPVSLELPPKAPVWGVVVQTAPAKHLIIEGVVTGWHFAQAVLTPGEIVRRMDSRTIALAAVATTTTGRWRWSSGAGVGIDTFTIDAFGGQVTTRVLSAHIGLGIDCLLGGRLAAFVAYRQTQPFSAALGVVSVSGGLRATIR